jgi:ATP synthase protein I
MSASEKILTHSEDQAEDSEAGFKPLTAEEADAWRKTQKSVSIWWVILLQVGAAFLVGAVVFWLVGVRAAGWSALYGGFSVVLPAVVMAHGLTSGRLARLLAAFPSGSLGGLVFWEGVKVLLTVVMLALAPVVVSELSWLALLAGLVIVLKVYWFAFLMLSRVKK